MSERRPNSAYCRVEAEEVKTIMKELVAAETAGSTPSLSIRGPEIRPPSETMRNGEKGRKDSEIDR